MNLRGFQKMSSRDLKLKCFWYRPDGIYYETYYKSYNLTKLYKKGEEVMDFLEKMLDDVELDIHRHQIKEVMKDLIYNKN